MQQKKIYFICLFIYVCTFGVCVLCVLAFHINNGIRFIKAKKYGPIKLLYTVSNYSCMHIIHVINYLRIYKEQLFCRKIGDTCHAQYTTQHTHTAQKEWHVVQYTADIYIPFTYFITMENFRRFRFCGNLFTALFSRFEFLSRFRLLILVLDFEYNLCI